MDNCGFEKQTLGKQDLYIQRFEIRSLSLTLNKNQFKRGLKIRPKMMNLLTKILQDTDIGKNFLKMTPVDQEVTLIVDK